MDQRGSVSARVRRLSRHVRGSGAASCDGAGVVKAPTLAEAGHSGRVSKARLSRPEKAFYRSMLRFRYARTPLKVVYKEEGGGGGGEDTYGGLDGVVVLEGEIMVPSSTSTAVGKTVVVFMHPSAVMNLLPLPMTLARAGVHVVTCASRYPHNDAPLIMEKVVRDLGAVIAHCRDKLGYARVVLGGWSGGGSLAAFYQSQAEAPIARRVAAPLPAPLSGYSLAREGVVLPPADGVMIMAAHSSRARILTEWLDPSIYLLRRGDHPAEEAKLRHLDLYARDAPKAPYSPAFVREFRAAQVARSRRITAWVKAELLKRARSGESAAQSTGFVLDGTMADPRWYDLTLEPNDRPTAGRCFLGDPAVANNAPAGLARFCTLASWLSQWSIDESNADGVVHIQRTSKPVLVVENTADDAVPASHSTAMFEAARSGASSSVAFVRVDGANHYYDGQRIKAVEAARVVVEWLASHGLVDIALPPPLADFKRAASSGGGDGDGGEDGEDGASPGDELAALRTKYDGTSPDAFRLCGINHLALTCSDMARTVAFYCGVMGLRLSKTIALPGGGQHFFFDIGRDKEALAFFWFPDAPPHAPGVAAPSEAALSQLGKHPTAAGAMNHVAFNAPEGAIEKYRKRLLESDLTGWVSPVVYHADTPIGFAGSRDDPTVSWVSVYFFGPDGELLEIAAQTRDFSPATAAKDIEHMPQKALHLDWKVALPTGAKGKHYAAAVKKKKRSR